MWEDSQNVCRVTQHSSTSFFWQARLTQCSYDTLLNPAVRKTFLICLHQANEGPRGWHWKKKTHYKPADTRPRQRDIYCNTQCNISGNYSSRVVNDLQHTAVGMAVVNLGCLSFFWTIIFAITISKKMLHWNKKGFCLFSNIKAFSLNLNDVPSYFLHYWSSIWCST